MPRNLLDLAKRLDGVTKNIEKAASDQAVRVAQTIVGDLAYSTPVDTSKALSNWVVSLETPFLGILPPHYYGESGTSQRASAAETINKARTILKGKRPGQTIFISNNLPYIRRLNDGYSRQAPAGFVERAALIGRRLLRNFKVLG